MAKYCITLLLVFVCLSAHTQTRRKYDDVIYLKSGSAARGKIIELKPGELVRIETQSGNVNTYKLEDVDRIEKHPVRKRLPTSKNKPSKEKKVFTTTIQGTSFGGGEF